MKQGVYPLKIRLGRRVIKTEIDSRKSLELMLAACERMLLPDTDKGQAAAELFVGIFGGETAQMLLDHYGKSGKEKQIPLLLCRILKRSARAELKRQRQRARQIVNCK